MDNLTLPLAKNQTMAQIANTISNNTSQAKKYRNGWNDGRKTPSGDASRELFDASFFTLAFYFFKIYIYFIYFANMQTGFD